MATQKNTSKKLCVVQKQQQAVMFRMQNLTFQQISERLGVSVSQAHRYVQNSLKDLAEKLSEDTQALRELHRQRLDRMAAGLWPAAETGNTQAITTMLKLMEREAVLLGLDVPSAKREEHTRYDEIAERLMRNAMRD